MYKKTIRELGFSNVITIPKAVMKSLKLNTGTILDLEIKDSKIIMTPVANQVLVPIKEGVIH